MKRATTILRRLLLFLALGCLAAGCAGEEAVSSVPEYHGQSRAQVVAALGKPAKVQTFPMSAAVDKFRIELQNHYPASDPANADVQIEELTWKDKEYWITLWLHEVEGQWVVLDSYRWHQEVQF